MIETHSGRIITFYSYKGGTGRTMALANVAWILAANGHKVLAVDWDLEGPGLHRFVHPFLDTSALESNPGVIELINKYSIAATATDNGRDPHSHAHYPRALDYPPPLNSPFPH